MDCSFFNILLKEIQINAFITICNMDLYIRLSAPVFIFTAVELLALFLHYLALLNM